MWLVRRECHKSIQNDSRVVFLEGFRPQIDGVSTQRNWSFLQGPISFKWQDTFFCSWFSFEVCRRPLWLVTSKSKVIWHSPGLLNLDVQPSLTHSFCCFKLTLCKLVTHMDKHSAGDMFRGMVDQGMLDTSWYMKMSRVICNYNGGHHVIV